MSGEPSLPPFHVIPLAQPAIASGPASGNGPASATPPSGGGSVHSAPFGVPAATQSANVAISSASGFTAGGGGIGLVALFIRSRESTASDFFGSVTDGF